jgi:hypothetical protein
MHELLNFLLSYRRVPDEFYHGTPAKEKADSIIRQGQVIPNEGKLYTAHDIRVPVSFALCGSTNWVTGEIQDLTWYMQDYGPYGYVFTLYPPQERLIPTPYPVDNLTYESNDALAVNECWQIDRRKQEELEWDCSNFFSIATLYWKNEQQIAASKGNNERSF